MISILDGEFNVLLDRFEPGINIWYGLPIVVSRKRYMMVTNSISLYTVFIPVGTINERKSILKNFRKELFERLVEDYGEDISLGIIRHLKFDKIESISRTNNRRILGSMNDFRNMISYLEFDFTNESLTSVMSGVSNRSPMSYLGMKSPQFAMRNFL